jgi:hypothetical protein
MKRLIGFCLAMCLVGGIVGCAEKAEIKKETTVTTPEGETTKTESTEIETSGENPPPVNP